MRIVLTAFAIAATPSIALAQSTTTGSTKPIATAPASNTWPSGRPRAKIPPAARSGEEGLRVGNVPPDTPPVEIRRVK